MANDGGAPGATGQGAGGGAPNGGTPAGGAPAGSEYGWLGDGITDDDKGYVQNKGWKSPGDVYSGYRNLEKLLGADRAGNTVIVPKEGAPKEEWDKFYSKLGRPESADKYELPVPQDFGDPEFAKRASAKFHELGIPAKSAKALAEWWNGEMGNARTAHDAASAQTKQAHAAEAAELRKSQGAALAQNEAIVDKAAAKFGFGEKEIDVLKNGLGPKRAFEFLLEIGQGLSEPDFVGGNGGGGNRVSTPEQAKLEINELRKDQEFIKKYQSGDQEARARMDRLHRMAYPEEQG